MSDINNGKCNNDKCNKEVAPERSMIDSLIEGHKRQDDQCSFLLASLTLDGYVKFKNVDSENFALSILYNLAEKGHTKSRNLLNEYCNKRYAREVESRNVKRENPGLYDFEGKRIIIDRKGPLTPVDVKLDVVDGKNVLNISFCIEVKMFDDLDIDENAFASAIYDGIMEWQGEYTVFGGQQLLVKIDIQPEKKLIDKVLVVPVTDFISEATKKAAAINKKGCEQLLKTIDEKRSFAVTGLRKWSVNSPKTIVLCSESNFTDYEEIKDVVKHEFGHVLGLGDMYHSHEDGFEGVEKGSFKELDSYFVSNKIYNLVMCNHHGPISNNDIEMVVLAFRENKMQAYQKCRITDKISKALGRGN